MCRPFVALAVIGLCLASGVLGGCRSEPPILAQRGAGHQRTDVTPAPPARSDGPGHSTSRAEAPAGGTVTVVETPVPVAAPEVDLALRVRNAYGFPAECIGPESVPEGITEFSIQLSVSLTATGTVTRARATAPQLSAAARACIQARADRMTVAGPIPDAPRTVSTQIDVRAVPRLAEADPQPPVREVPPGAQAPAEVLPAVVGDGPAPGSVAPAVTLPAVVGTGPAPGSVAAAEALPARGGSGTWTWIESSAEARGEVADDLNDD